MSSIDIIGPDGKRLPARSKAPKGARYRARWRTPEGASRSRTFSRKHEAEQFLASVGAAKLDGGYVDRSKGAQTLKDFADTWVATRRTPAGEPLRPRTAALYRQQLASHVYPGLGNVRLRDLSTDRVAHWYARLPETTVKPKVYRLVRTILGTAVKRKLIAANPVDVEHAGREVKKGRPDLKTPEVWRLAASIDPRYRALVLVAAYGGLRWGELLGLERGDLDFAARSISVKRQIIEIGGKKQVGPPKTEAGVRTIAVGSVAMVELQSHLDAFVADDVRAPVFRGPKGAIPSRSNFSALWARAREEAGVPGAHFHDLRHYAGTLAAQRGATTKELMGRLGHSSWAAAMGYQHAAEERDRLLAERIDEAMAEDRNAADRARLRVVGDA